MAITTAGKGGGGFDVDSVLNFEKRSGIKDGEIENFITKVDAVNAAIQAMKDGELDPADVHVDGVPTIEEERQMEEEKRRKRLELAKREQENRDRQKREENEKWWRGAELLYGERKQLSWADAFNKTATGKSATAGLRGNDVDQATPPATRSLTEEERARLKERYSMEYSRWETWTPSDPATLAELKEREEEEDQKRSKEFEESNPDFCKQMVDDMKSRSEASEKKESAATTARLKGNRFYKAKRWEKALELYMTSLKAKPYAVNTLANVAQTLIKLERWPDAVEFCDRALHVDGKCIKALSRRASAFVKLAGECLASSVSVVSTAAVAAAPALTEIEIVSGATGGGSVDVSSPAAAEKDANESVSAGAGGRTGYEGEKHAYCERHGGREGLMALALLDLEAAVEADPDGEDVRRQREALSQEIEEEKAEAEVMKRVLQESRRTSCSGHAPAGDEAAAPAEADPSLSPEVAPEKASATEREDKGGKPAGGVAETCARTSLTISSGSEDDLRTIDTLLEEALSSGRRCPKELEMAVEAILAGKHPAKDLPLHPLLRLTSILEDSPTAIVYFRASGGLARLAGATASAARCWGDSIYSAASADGKETNETRKSPSPSPNSGEGSSEDGGGFVSDDGDKRGPRAATAQLEEDRATFASMLRAVSAALKGGERLAQIEASKSGLLGTPCAQAMRAVCDRVGGDAAAAGAAGAAGAAALLLSRVVNDVTVRTHVARSADLLSGLVGLIGACSMFPPDVESAAASLRAVLIGRTASIAAKTLTDAAATARVASTGVAEEAERTRTGWPATAVGEALLLWKEGGGLMQGAPASTGCALCGVLANLAMHEDFRGSFARRFSPGASASAGGGIHSGRVSTVAAVLVLVAGDMTADRSEARTVALAALVNACLHNPSVQAATFSAGGLALALATLSLEGGERARFVPPLVAARSAGLLARLCSLPAALEAMARPGAVDRIVQAAVRSSALGGNLFDAPVAPANRPGEAATESSSPTEVAVATATAHVTERENLVRTLGSILRFKPPSTPAVRDGARKDVSAAPSSNVPAAVAVPEDARAYLFAATEKLGLAGALVSFLPPARREGAEGVTVASVALRPKWSAPPAVTANVCVCLLHLLDGELSGRIAEQVVAADGIPRLISLFANSGGEGGTLSVRTNAAICLAKLAREPRHKKMIADLRGMEMLVQAGAGLA